MQSLATSRSSCAHCIQYTRFGPVRVGSTCVRHQTGRHNSSLCRGLPGFGSSEVPASTKQEWQVPSQLLPSIKAADQASPSSSTVYTIRLSTSFDRGSALSEPLAGVNVCLIGKNGSAVLHRIAPVNNPQDNQKVMQEFCSLVGEDAASVGADCSSLDSMDQAPSWPAGKEPTVKPRFQEGSVDEVSFIAPELGSLSAIMLAPEQGSWMCDEVDVFSSRTNHMDRFVCRTRLGGRKGDPAAYLTPVPPDAVVYGTGDAARIITKEQAAALQAISMSAYGDLKARLLLTTALLTLGGSGVAALASGVDAAVPFALGGMAGLLYQRLLQLGADAAVAGASAAPSTLPSASALKAAAAGGVQAGNPAAAAAVDSAQEGLSGRLLKVLGSSAVRLALLTSAALVAVWSLQDGRGKDGAEAVMFQHLSPVNAWQMGVGLCGFMMYKVAVLGVSLVPAPQSKVPEPAQHQEKNA